MLSLGIPDARVTLTPYVVDNDWWTTRSATVYRTSVRASWGAGPADSVVLFCAKLQPWKRPIDLLRAFAKANLPNAILIFAGEGALRAELESEVTALGVTPRVRFLGFVNQSQLPAVYTAADIMVLPSEYEPFAVVVNEAMCCGCPVVVSDRVGAAQDLIAPVHPELIYPCGDIDALTSLLATLAADPVSLKRLGQRCVAQVQTWAPQRNVSTTIEAIEHAIARIRRPGPAASQRGDGNPESAVSEKRPNGSGAFSKLSSRKSHPE
jgi:glycosyltransferase involved in cell wall biosynthesis